MSDPKTSPYEYGPPSDRFLQLDAALANPDIDPLPWAAYLIGSETMLLRAWNRLHDVPIRFRSEQFRADGLNTIFGLIRRIRYAAEVIKTRCPMPPVVLFIIACDKLEVIQCFDEEAIESAIDEVQNHAAATVPNRSYLTAWFTLGRELGDWLKNNYEWDGDALDVPIEGVIQAVQRLARSNRSHSDPLLATLGSIDAGDERAIRTALGAGRLTKCGVAWLPLEADTETGPVSK